MVINVTVRLYYEAKCPHCKFLDKYILEPICESLGITYVKRECDTIAFHDKYTQLMLDLAEGRAKILDFELKEKPSSFVMNILKRSVDVPVVEIEIATETHIHRIYIIGMVDERRQDLIRMVRANLLSYLTQLKRLEESSIREALRGG